MSSFRKSSMVALGAATVLALLAAGASAQGQGGGRRGGGGMGGMGGSRLGLLSSDQIQKELELVDDQKAAIEKLRQEVGEEMRANRGNGGGGGDRAAMQARMAEARQKIDAKLQTILLPQQYDRLKQLDLQVQGPLALADKDVATSLGLSDDQQQKLTSIRDESMAKRGELFQGGGGGDRQAMRAKMEELRKAESDQMLAVLSADQQAKFEQMKGKLIDIDRSQIGFTMGGGGRRNGGQGGQGANTQ